MLILFAILAATITHNAIAEVKNAYACEFNHVTLECPLGEVLNIKSANYGRTNTITCRSVSYMSNTNCYSGRATNIVVTACNNKRQCKLHASNNIFGDPCSGILKYLEVQYECIKPKACKEDQFQCYDGTCIPETSVWNGFKDCTNGEDEKGSDYESEYACEDYTLHINCRRGELISVINANYGRLDKKHCLGDRMSNTNCKSTKSLSIVKTRCNLKPSCSVSSANGGFGDPCYGIYKYLEVHYQCIQLPECTENEFRCNSGSCINSNKLCNGHWDCEHGEDERGCNYLTEFACENTTLTLECPVGDIITTIGANYGRQLTNICKLQTNTNCISSGTKNRVENRCNGKRTCSIDATNREFGDPCLATNKYLAVHYECRGIHRNEITPNIV